MSKIVRFFRKKILLKYDNSSIEEFFSSSFVEQINDFQVHLGSLVIFLYSILNIVINIVDSSKQNRNTEIILFSILITISLIVLIVGRIVVSSRFILLYLQQIFFIALHTILIISASERSDKLYLIIVCYSLHIIIMPQSQHIYVIISNVIFVTLILISYNQFDWQQLWQLWILLSIIGIELRFFVDEKQKRLLFHDEKQTKEKDNDIDELPVIVDQGSPTSSTRANHNQNNIKNNDINRQLNGKQQQYFASNRPTIGQQQTQQNSGNNILANQGSNIQENVETQRQIPITQQSPQSQQLKALYKQNSKNGLSSQSVYNQQFSTSKQNSLQNNNLVSGHNHFNNYNGKSKIESPTMSNEQQNHVSNLKRKMTIFHIRQGMEELKKLMQSSSLHINEIGQVIQNGDINGISNSLHKSELPHTIQLSPLISNQFDNPYQILSATKRAKQNNIYNFLPCSFIYCKLDPQNMEQIQLIFANHKAKTDYSITDNAKLDDFLQKSKVSSSLLKFQDTSINSLKKIILLNYQQILDDNKFIRSQVISQTHLLSSDYKQFQINFNISINNILIFVSRRNLGNFNLPDPGSNFFHGSTKKNNTVIHKRLSLLPNRVGMMQSELKEKENKGVQVLIDFHGKKYVIKIVILSDELYLFINDDGFEKFILEKKRRATCDQLISIIDMMINRFQTLQQMLCNEIQATKKEILMEIFLATNYAQNIQNSIKEQLQQKIDIINRKIVLSETLPRVKEMIERKYKNVQVLVDEEIPSECKKIYNDPYHLVRTLTNIIENSYSNTQSGFVQILLHQSRIFKDHLRFDIIDSGKGIDPQILQLINESNFFNDEEEEDAVKRLFLLFSSLSQQSSEKEDEKEHEKFSFSNSIIKGFGLKFSHHMIKIIGPYNRMFAESIPGKGSRISFIVYKEGPPSQDTVFKPYQFKNNNFEQEMEYFNPLNRSPNNNKNCSLEEYIEHMNNELNRQETPSLENSFINVNIPNQFKTFKTPFKQEKSKSINISTSNREVRATSAHQIKQNKNKVSFSKIRSQKSIIENQRNFLIQKQLSPLIQGMSVANVANFKLQQQNSLRLSSSPPNLIQNTLNVPQNQEIYIENISNYFRNIDPASSQMYSDYQNNNSNNGIGNAYQIQQIQLNQFHQILNKRSSKENNQNNNQNLHFKKNNSIPSNPNNSIFFQDLNLNSGQNSLNVANQLNNGLQSHGSLTNMTHIGQNTTFYAPKGEKIEHLINQNNYNQSLMNNYSNAPSSQFIGNDSYQQQEDGYFINKIQH